MIGMLLTFAMLSSTAASCPLERAHYVLRDAPGVVAGFRPVERSPVWGAGLALYVRSAQPERTWWFLPYSGNGVGTRGHLASTHDVTARGWVAPGPDSVKERPLGDLDYLAMTVDYRVLEAGALRAGQGAPAHLLIPDLQHALWYRTPSDARQSVPTAFFDLTGCET
jgi:hypothetical protein